MAPTRDEGAAIGSSSSLEQYSEESIDNSSEASPPSEEAPSYAS